MHRDISIKNCLILSLAPPRAAICDFGKCARAARARDSLIGPVYTLAPEVDGKRWYDGAIDVWSLGLVLLRAYVPKLAATRLGALDHGRAVGLVADILGIRSPNEARLGLLIADMIAWRAADRPSAAQALAVCAELLEAEVAGAVAACADRRGRGAAAAAKRVKFAPPPRMQARPGLPPVRHYEDEVLEPTQLIPSPALLPEAEGDRRV